MANNLFYQCGKSIPASHFIIANIYLFVFSLVIPFWPVWGDISLWCWFAFLWWLGVLPVVAICIPSLEKYLFRSSVHILIQLFVFFGPWVVWKGMYDVWKGCMRKMYKNTISKFAYNKNGVIQWYMTGTTHPSVYRPYPVKPTCLHITPLAAFSQQWLSWWLARS